MYKSREDTAWVLYQVTNCCDIIKSLQVNVDTINYKTYEQAVFVSVYLFIIGSDLVLNTFVYLECRSTFGFDQCSEEYSPISKEEEHLREFDYSLN